MFATTVTVLAAKVNAIRSEGIPVIPAQEPRQMPNGQMSPARAAVAAVTPEAINQALGTANCAVLDALAEALGL